MLNDFVRIAPINACHPYNFSPVFKVNIMFFRVFILVFCCLALFSACNNEAITRQNAQLIGYWELTNATRNQRPTAVLNGSHFEFLPGDSLLTNLPLRPDLQPGEEIADTYKLSESEIAQKAMPVKYRILNLNDTALTLAMDMRSVPFELSFRKTTRPVVLPDTLEQEGGDTLQR
jgi:hypothetical protein